MRAVVLGATGHIGTYLVPMLAKAGFETIAVTRSMSAPYEEDFAWRQVERVLLDRDNDPEFPQKFAALKADIVVDLVSFTLETTKNMVALMEECGVSHYLYCSSCWAHGRARLLPFDPDDLNKEPIDEYGKQKFASEMFLKEQWRKRGFPATIIMPGQISGPGWDIINPWGNTSHRAFQLIASGEQIFLPNFGQEIIHHVHGYDVAQVFFQAITHRTASLGESFDAVASQAITTYGFARHLYEYFGREEKIGFLGWEQWCEYEGNPEECEASFLHLARSGTLSIEKPAALLGYQPKYTVLETIDQAVASYVDRGLIAPAS